MPAPSGPPPGLFISPNPFNLGTAIAGGTLTGSFKLTVIVGGLVSWTILSNSNPDFVIGPPSLGALDNGDSVNVPVSITEAGAGSQTTNVVIRASNASGVITTTLVINASFVAAGSTLIANPTQINFPPMVLNQTPILAVTIISNNTGGPVTVTGATIAGHPFSTPTVFPFTIPNGGSASVEIDAKADVVGVFSGSITLHAAPLPDLVVSLSIIVYFVISVDMLTGATSVIILGMDDNSINEFDGTNFDPNLDCALIFNGTLWNSPSNEKTLARLEVYYENVGVCSGLKLDLFAWRPSLPVPAFETQSKTITIGDVSADASERSAYFDVNLSGEILIMKLTRLANTGPVSLLGFIPWFTDRGEKVENV